MTTTDVLLSAAAPPPPEATSAISLPDVSAHPLLNEAAWIAHRDSGIAPYVGTELATTEESRREFLTGATLLGIAGSIHPQQLRLSDTLTAGRFLNGVVMPRRSSKTTTLFAILLGRCALRPGHLAGFTLLTTQKKTAERYRLDIYGPLVRMYPDADTRPMRVYRGNGTERVEFPNGSLLSVLSPDGDAFRSGAYDTLLADEGGEASPEMGSEIVSSVLPSFDTRPGGQFIVAGTVARYRQGSILWETITDPEAGVIRYTVPDSVTSDELADWEPSEAHPAANVRALMLACHPGIGTLTTEDVIYRNFRKLSEEQFLIEYAGVFGLQGVTGGLLDFERWRAAAEEGELPAPPERFTMAVAAHPDQQSACIVAAWRDDAGVARLLLLDHQRGIRWLAAKSVSLSRKYSTPIVHDAFGAVLVEVEAMKRARPLPRMLPQNTRQITTAAGLLVKEFEAGNVKHYGQEELDEAARVAIKRRIGTGSAWGFGRAQQIDDIAPLEAAAMALRVYDETPAPTARRKVFVTT